MSSILTTPAKLIDALITVNIKLFFAMDGLNDKETYTGDERLQIASRVIALNKKRNRLMDEIDENFLEWLKGKELYPFFPTHKDYNETENKKN